ncbi:MAG: hypothetical protein R2752_14465 [Vicinamibacterales bacterium]
MTTAAGAARRRAGWVAALVVCLVYGGLAVGVDFRAEAEGFHADEATYFLIGESLAYDWDLEYRAEDLSRAFALFPSGPNGVFLKRGVDVTGVTLTTKPPFVAFPGVPEPAGDRLYFGKAFIYPLAAAPFVRLFGVNGFLVLNALLLAAAFLASYTFLSARGGVTASLLLAGAFVFATVVPVYYVWIAPELFNWAVGVVAYFLWLYKAVATDAPSPRWAWLRAPWTDLLAAALIGVLTFSKVSNVLLLAPLGAWLLWRRQWTRAVATGVVWAAVTAMLFGANVASSGEWNYQGGDRRTCYDNHPFPFQEPGRGLEQCDERARNAALTDVMFDPEVFWPNLRANVVYFFVGRNGGLVPYFFPAAFATGLCLLARGRRQPWQWFVLVGLYGHAMLFVLTQPYTWIGSGGSMGNRYFMGAYGPAVFLLPPVSSIAVAIVPWVAGLAFTGSLVLHPFSSSIRPATRVKHGLFRYLPVELTQVNDLPMNTEEARVRIWYGDDGVHEGFQVYYLDDNAYLQEADKLSFWTRGESEAQYLIKSDPPFRWTLTTLTAGQVPTVATLRAGGERVDVPLEAGQSATVLIHLPPGFPYKGNRDSPDQPPVYVWTMSVSSSTGFFPVPRPDGTRDERYLGVRVKPLMVR